MFNLLQRMLQGGAQGSQPQPLKPNQMAKDPYTKRVAPTIGGGILEQYGIYTPEQKLQRQAEQEAQQEQQQQMMDLMRSQMDPSQNANYMALQGGRQFGKQMGQMGQGYAADHGMLGLQPHDNPNNPDPYPNFSQNMEAMRNGQGGGEQGGVPQDPIQLFNLLMKQTGGDVAKSKLLLGQYLIQQGDAQTGGKLIEDAKKAMLEQEQAAATIQKDKTQAGQNEASTRNLNSEVKERDSGEPKNGDLQTVWNGRDAVQQRYDRKTHAWVPVGRGDRAPTTTAITGTPEDFRTDSQKGADQQKFDEIVVSGEMLIKDGDSLIESLKKPGAHGTAGEIMLKGKQAVDTVTSLIQAAKPEAQIADYSPESVSPSVWTEFDKQAGNRAYEKAKIYDLAYAYASLINGQSGKAATERDIEMAIARIGGSYSDAKLTAQLIRDMQAKVRFFVNAVGKRKGMEPPIELQEPEKPAANDPLGIRK